MKAHVKLMKYLQVLLIAILLASPSVALSAVMGDYCLIPPYVKRDVSVNIMLIMDNSDDMNNRAYTSAYDATKAYLGYFDPGGCYVYGPSGHNNRFWRTAAAATNHTCSDTSQFPGNVLNWATMSRLSILKRVLVGGNLQPQVSYSPNYIVAEGGGWVAATSGCNYSVTTASKLSTTGTCPAVVNNADLNIDINFGAPGGKPYEAVQGILQNLMDTNQDLNPDTNAPRLGLIDFGNNDVPRINQCLPFQNTLQAFLNSIAQGSTVNSSPIANADKLAIDYYAGTASCSTRDPYTSCASWESSCTGTVPCRKSFIMILTTGSNVSNTSAYPPYIPNPLCNTDSAFPNTSTQPLVEDTCYGANTDLRATIAGKQNVLTYVVHTFGSTTNEDVLKATATIAGQGKYYSAGEENLEDILKQAFQDILKRASAGTAASVLASGEGSGANLIQAVFYPRRKFPNSTTGIDDEIAWTGTLSNFWYYVDPFFGSSSIYEDNASTGVLNLTNDNKVTFFYDPNLEHTMATRSHDTNGDGIPDTTLTPDIEFESLKSLWEAGKLLWNRGADDRKIYTTTDGSGLIDFSSSPANASTLLSSLALPTTDLNGDTFIDGDLNRDGTVDASDASILIRYVRGEDASTINSSYTWLRPRSVMVGGSGPNVWKLGDILNSTPRLSSWIQLNTYDQVYSDTTYSDFVNDVGLTPDPASTTQYKNRGMVLTGGNDGMLHAFKLGKLEVNWSGQGTYEKARLTDGSTPGTKGQEMWAFIPKNALPYLKYLADPAYCHVYTVDLSPYIFDASIGSGSGDQSGTTRVRSSWRTILIGGMRYGGACRNSTGTCNGGTSDCVKTPTDGNGYSSYFALDITDQNNPTLLWEFSNEQLGFATTGPAIVRISTKVGSTTTPDKTTNGKWFVVFGSGPTGPISTTDQQFLGHSDQNLRLFILDLKTGSLLRTIDTGIANAFAGSMLNSAHDADITRQGYQDDAIYIPFVKKCTSTSTICDSGTWTSGGVGRLLTNGKTSPSDWGGWSTVIDDAGPVTASVARLQNKFTGDLWLYFGTGRYYFEQGATVDDQMTQRRLFGIKEPCFSSGLFQTSCPSAISGTSGLTDVTTNASAVPSNISTGWYINLDRDTSTSATFRSERVITDPLSTTSGVVFFTSYRPYNDQCAFGGNTFLWAVKYDTGGAAGALLKGQAIIQESTGSIEQINLAGAFTDKQGRRSAAHEGVPPTSGSSILTPPPPVKRTIHIRER